MVTKKASEFSAKGIAQLAKNKPVVYQLSNKNDEVTYVGVAKRGRVGERLQEHLPGQKDATPGAVKVKIQQMASIDDALKAESKLIQKIQPKHNKQGK
jgi:excinuclease UvrABC nuclease subunit